MVPDIVKPNPGPPIPSAMKGGGGHPPRSPKDKVTFAEFTDVCVTKIDEVVREESDASVAETVIQVDNCNNTLEVVNILDLQCLDQRSTENIYSTLKVCLFKVT